MGSRVTANAAAKIDRAFAVEVVQRLREAGFEALWAGGCVRDLLMGHVPDDYDVATTATPKQVRKLFGYGHTLPVGVSFGVIIVLPEDRRAQQIEVATFRTESGYSDGRRPDSVAFSTAEEDAHRRDFTINGMFFDPIEEQIIDYVGGQSDLKRGIIRAIGLADERFAEDKLRMLRAIRFAARFRFDLDVATDEAITRHSRDIAMVSGERIAAEIRRSLETERADWAVDHWARTGLMPIILPELVERWGLHGETALALLNELPKVEEAGIDWRVCLASLLWIAGDRHAIGPMVQGLRSRLKLSNEDSAAIRFTLSAQALLEDADHQPWSQIQPLMIDPNFPLALELLAARHLLGQARGETVAWLRDRSAWEWEQLDPPPLVDGRDLIQLGLNPGPEFRQLLQAVRDHQLDGQLKDRQSAMSFVTASLP